MASIHFVLRTTTKGNMVPVYLRFSSSRKINTSVLTGYQVFPEYWDTKREEIKDSMAERGLISLEELAGQRRKYLKLKAHIQNELNDLASKGTEPSREWLETTIYKFNNPDKKTDNNLTLNQYVAKFIEEIEQGLRHTDKGMVYAKGTVKSFKGTQTQFTEFQGKKRLNFDDITIDTYNDLLKFFNEKNYALNTTGRHIKNLKTIMRAAREAGLHRNEEINRKGFKVIRTDVENVYLNEDEIQRLFDLDLTDNKEWNQARDIFLIGCYTGQRFGDYSRINPDMKRTLSNGMPGIELFQQKTQQKVTIPIKPELDMILKKYNYQLPRVYEQKINQRIKFVAEKAGITDLIPIEESKGGFIKKTTVAKNLLIKTHTARRSFCTNMFLAGFSVISIMKISGHKTDKEFMKYIKISEEENATVLSEHPYFNTPVMRIAQ